MAQIPHVWVDVYDAAGNRQGSGYVRTLENLNFSNILDGIGEFSFQVPSTDPVASSLLSEESRVQIYLDGQEEGDDKRLLISGIIRKITANNSSNSWSMICSGPDSLDELTRYNVMLGLEYNADNHSPPASAWDIDEIIDDIVGKVSWSATTTATGQLAARFDGVNLVKVLRAIHEQTGNHFRLGTSVNTIEFGPFGVNNNVSLLQRARGGYSNDPTKLLIESIRIDGDSYEVVNRLVPLGATSGGDTSLTLESVAATRGTAFGDLYDIKTTTRNGVQIWYIEDEDSQTEYGVIEDIKNFDQIQIQSGNSQADIEAAANALYDAAVYYMLRRKDKIVQYTVTASDPRVTIRPGDKIHMTYKGFITRIKADNSVELLPPQNINDYFWVMETNEQYGTSGSVLTLTLSTVDRIAMSEEELIVGAIESTRIEKLSVKSYTNIYTIPFKGAVDNSNDVPVDLLITSRMQKVRSVILRLETDVFEAFATGAAASGSHRHKMATLISAGAFNSAELGNMELRFASGLTGSGTVNAKMAMSVGIDLFTEVASDPHEHDMVYGIFRDTVFPEDVNIEINGVDRTGALGGPWGTSGSDTTQELDITQYILSEATLQKNHTIVLGCGSSQGRVRGVIEVYVDIQNLG